MRPHFFAFCLLGLSIIMSSCSNVEREESPKTSPNNVVFMVMNRTGHNGPASMNCGRSPEAFEFTFISPNETFTRIISGDTQEFIGLEILEGERITVVVKDPQSKEELVSKSTLFEPSANGLPEGANPLIRLCPKDFLEFKYF